MGCAAGPESKACDKRLVTLLYLWVVLQDLKAKLVTNGTPPKQHIVIISYDLVQKMQSYVKQ